MKAIQLEDGIKLFYSIPKSWGSVVGGFDTLSDTDLESYGFYHVEIPASNSNTEVLGGIFWDSSNSVFTYPIENKVFTQTLAEMKVEKIKTLKSIYAAELSKTDWYVIRAQEGISIPQDITNARTTLRSDCATDEVSINSKSTKAEVASYPLTNFI